MQWWAWIAVGAILLGSELAFVDAQFYLVFVGAAALVVGFLSLARADLAVWLQWLISRRSPSRAWSAFGGGFTSACDAICPSCEAARRANC